MVSVPNSSACAAEIPEEGIDIPTTWRLPRDPIFDEDNESEPYNEFEWDGRIETASEARMEMFEENHNNNNMNRMMEQVLRRRLPIPGMPTPTRGPARGPRVMHPDRRGRIIMDGGCWECGANPVNFWNLPLLSNGAFAWYDDRPICSILCLNDYVAAKSGVDLTQRLNRDRPEPVSNQCFLNHPRYARWHRPPMAARWNFQR